jgi:hypothetical protein
MCNKADFLPLLSCEQGTADVAAVISKLVDAITQLPVLDLVDCVPHSPGACANKTHIDMRGMAYVECTLSCVIIGYLCTHGPVFP